MKKILYTHPDENIAYLIDRMENTEENALYIVADQNPALFTDAVNIKLLRREAAALGKNAVIVSLNPAVLAAARNASMDTLETSAMELEAEEGQAAVPAVSSHDAEIPADAEEEVSVRVMREEQPSFSEDKNKSKEPRPPLKERNAPLDEEIESHHGGIAFSWKIIIFSFAGAGVLAGLGFWALAPRLSVSIVPKKETISFDFQATADNKLSAIDARAGKIPGQIIKAEKEVSGEFIASVKQNAQTKAEGRLAVYNAFGAGAQVLVKGTRFAAKDGKIFRLKEGVTVPGATLKDGLIVSPGIAEADAVADQAGAEYNIGPSDFSIPGFSDTPKFGKFYAKSTAAFAGGGLEGSFTANTDDMDKAKKALTEKLIAHMQEYIQANIPQGLIVLDGARTQSETEFFADIPGKDGTFKATLKGKHEVFAFAASDAAALAENKFTDKLAQTQKTVPGTRVVSYAAESLHAGKSALSFTIKVNELVAGFVDESHLRARLAGKGEEEIKRILKEDESIESAEVAFWPFWISIAPENTNRITVTAQGI